MGEYYIDVRQVNWKWNIEEFWMNPQRELDPEHVSTIEDSMKKAPEHRWRPENIMEVTVNVEQFRNANEHTQAMLSGLDPQIGDEYEGIKEWQTKKLLLIPYGEKFVGISGQHRSKAVINHWENNGEIPLWPALVYMDSKLKRLVQHIRNKTNGMIRSDE